MGKTSRLQSHLLHLFTSISVYLCVKEDLGTFVESSQSLHSQKTVFSPLAESTYRHQANIDDEVVTMEILDTAGQVRKTIPETFVVNIKSDPVWFLILEFFLHRICL